MRNFKLMRYYFFFFLLLPFLRGSAQPTEPILTLNTEMHTAGIRRISTDQGGRYLLTASLDKTAKLWDATTGSLIRTFHPPIGYGLKGILHSCALSPDGSVAAVGGYTTNNDTIISIYIFNATTGEMTERLDGLPNVIIDLEFSPNGRYLAAALSGGNGIRIWHCPDYTLQAQDTDYAEDTYSIAFDTEGRLATACRDGYLRLYDTNMKLSKKVKTTGGVKPMSIAFSPDGRQLAVGYEDSPELQVLNATTLTVNFSPNVRGAKSVGFHYFNVAFSADGATLAAGGYLQNTKSVFQFRVWSQTGQGKFTDYDASGNTITDIKPLPGGAFVFGSTLPDWGIIDPLSGQRTRYRNAETSSFIANDKSHFRVGAGGAEIGLTPFGKSPMRFAIKERILEQKASLQPSPVVERKGLKLTDWLNRIDPKLNGKAIDFMDQNEICRSADISNNGKGFALSTEFNICYADATGELLWYQQMKAPVLCVNIDDYDLVVAAALMDGTIRWFRLTDGALLLSLFIHPDNRRWFLWTPSGYYDCAPGAEDLLGWHVNKGPDQAADYYPVSKFRETYYRPDVIDLVLETLDVAKAVERADQMANRRSTSTRSVTEQLPPTVRIHRPSESENVSSTQITLEYSVQSPGDENVTSVRINVDGRPVATERGFKPGQKNTATVAIPASDCLVSVIAENRFGPSEPATVRLKWGGKAPAISMVDLRPALYVLAIGVSQYTNPALNKLDLAAKDAGDFTNVMAAQKGLFYREVKVRKLTDAAATKDAILDGLQWLQEETTSRDVAMLFFAGHGMDDNTGNFFFLPVGADPAKLKSTGLAHSEVQTTVASVPGKIIVFMDACHSGGVMKAIDPNRRGSSPDINGMVNELISAENGGIVFSSATSRQYALEDKAWGNGAFTKAVVEGLAGGAKDPVTGKITWKMLDVYVSERVKSLTGGKQSPVTVGAVNVPDFPLAAGR